MSLSIQDFLNFLERHLVSPVQDESSFFSTSNVPSTYPPVPICLILGNGQSEARRVGWAIEAGETELQTAEECGLDLLLLWKSLWATPPDTLRSDRPGPGLAVERLTRARCAVAVIGPALENSPWAPGLWLAERLQLANRLPLRRSFPSPTDRLKLVVFAPRGYEDTLIEAVAQGGGGRIGRYSHCTFRAVGTGTYRPLEGAQPWAGAIGRLEQAEETRLETVVPRNSAATLIAAIRAVHPYEEMAYDLYPLEELREDTVPWGWIGTSPVAENGDSLRTTISQCLEKISIPSPPLPVWDDSDDSPSDRVTRGAICLNEDPVGVAEARDLVQAKCDWGVFGRLSEEARRFLTDHGVTVFVFPAASAQEAACQSLWSHSSLQEKCRTAGIYIERVSCKRLV